MATNNGINNTVAGPFTSLSSITSASGNVTITSGNLVLTAATSSSVSSITIGGNNVLHAYGTDNLFLGTTSGNFTLTTGSAIQNVGFGTLTLNALTTGASNVAAGYQALQKCTTGSLNVALGYQALTNLTSGSNNLAVGEANLNNLTTGSYNSGLGYAAGQSLTTSDSSNMYWNNVGVSGESNTLRLGTAGTGAGQISTCFIAGINGVTVTGSAVLCSTAGQLGTVVSSRRFKENIVDMAEVSADIYKLRPVTFTWIKNPEMGVQPGLIAEEVHAVMPQLVIYDDEKQPQSVKYHELPVLLLNELKKLKNRVDVLCEKINKEKA